MNAINQKHKVRQWLACVLARSACSMQSACRDRRPQVVSTHLVCGQAAGLVLTLRGECGSSPIMSDMYCQNVFIVGPQRKESNGTERAPGVISEVSIKRTKISREQIASAPDPCLPSCKLNLKQKNAVHPVVYTKLLVGEDAVQDLLHTPHWQKLQQNMKAGLVFLCEAGCHWLVDDGIRLMPTSAEGWMKVDHTFRSMLGERAMAYTLVPKDLAVADRVELVLSLCERRADTPRLH
ncbi:hypothetical protein CLAFUW4_13957 [Fulvia fulva]|uniref:Uncharacterized protein n=1 Tax=Passalora fulva TaxID=5499 RepID=A0A9Q8UW06_PASFU|nr:uncharacterized protein CLAFUR5_13797 [Fulvia fulva]KAK4610529.1 hypothetical protein CLAFUR4_13960 [Fulvia fulva]KAK4611103.1 hypothetical protein CLAFUR0_13964 [Fulvia fulva]UJO24402.1 hypothetical protein CLAFUR5_13797 [Fulvia fulva]WPV22224.1 hypothetical protein CLAFUW4_13957 [Fulvia fulva]WPV36742.1 hypothetical protein CLAFUW7_13965 [Fulvia fulva]